MGGWVIMPFLEHKSCGILTRRVWSVVVGNVVLATHIVHSLETNRAEPISRQILVLSEHILFTLKVCLFVCLVLNDASTLVGF